jgi:tetratricopeptide (TPR) repeat protein
MADEAIKLSHKTLETDPGHHEPYSSIGEAYTVKGNFAEAEEWYRKCIDVNKHFYPTYWELAKMCLREERTT